MAVANGVANNRNVTITTKFTERQSGRQSKFFTYPYVTYSGSNGLVNASQIESYILFERPPKANELGLSNAYNKNGSILVVGAKLDTSGRLIPLKENETFYLKQDQTLASLNSSSNSYVFSDPVRRELNNKNPGGLYQQSINGFKTVLGRETGLSSQQLNGIYGGILGTGASTPGIPTLDSNNPQAPAATPPSQDNPNGEPAETGDELTEEEKLELSSFEVRGQIENTKNINFGKLSYPKGIESNGQDVIKFDILEFSPRKFKENSPILEKRGFKENTRGTIYLGIQPRITDTNTVKWTDDSMNAFEMVAQGSLMQFFKNAKSAEDVTKIAGNAFNTLDNGETVNSVLTKLASAAVSSNNNLFSRLSGAIVNPNMELLFQGPALREFPFSFSMTPRDEDEAKQVKSIIRAFKQASAVQVGFQYLFLKSPFVFRIEYLTPDSQTNKLISHPSLNKIKTCALTSISVDYTPAGSYMTYNDKKRTMTSYNVQMSFTELDPVYDEDYAEIKNLDVIGY